MSKSELRFVALLGSLRRGSFSRTIALALDELAPDDVEVTLLGSVGSLPHYSEDLQAIDIPATVAEMADAIRISDAVIVVSPEYNHSMPGSLKNALDWLSRLPICPFSLKPIAIQSTSTGHFGGVRMQSQLRQTLLALNATVLNPPEVAIARVGCKIDQQTGLLVDEPTRVILRTQLKRLSELARHGGVSEAA